MWTSKLGVAVGGVRRSISLVYSHWTSSSKGSAETRCEAACWPLRLSGGSSRVLCDKRARK